MTVLEREVMFVVRVGERSGFVAAPETKRLKHPFSFMRYVLVIGGIVMVLC